MNVQHKTSSGVAKAGLATGIVGTTLGALTPWAAALTCFRE